MSVDTAEFEGKYLTFNLLEEFYGVSVGSILQIIAIPDITKIPQTPAFVKGVINLRGRIIPVVDLRLKFLLEEQVYDDRTSVIIIKMKLDGREIFIGVIVDKVNEVIDINKNEIESSPSFGVDLDTQFILAMAKVKNKVVSLLDIGKILTNKELMQIQDM
ncbi:MAG: chemotaxis protein CheW [Candidatus Cloacimonetes bacterium]|nr:chemotaxis protein CheW [Candidatus Cloacimonadota bacterium]